MPEERLKSFLSKVKDDSNLQEKLKAAQTNDEAVSIAKEIGYDLTTERGKLFADMLKVWMT